MLKELGYDRKVKRDCIEYTLHWSHYIPGEKFTLLKKLTEMTGLYVFFYQNEYNRLYPLFLGAAWYSGLRPMALRFFNPASSDNIPSHVISKFENEKVKIFLKFIEVYVLEDFLDIFFKLKEHYKDVFTDTNGLVLEKKIDIVKIVDKETKTYYKDRKIINM
jgi:hypothetical protein